MLLARGICHYFLNKASNTAAKGSQRAPLSVNLRESPRYSF